MDVKSLREEVDRICSNYSICSNGCPLKVGTRYMCNEVLTRPEEVYNILHPDSLIYNITENDIISIFNG